MELALGTAQFGLSYGVAGRGVPVPESEVRAILERAAERGVRLLDTAIAYGDIEERLARLAKGLPYSVVSKLPPVPDELSAIRAEAFVLAHAQRSRDRLGNALVGLMCHRSEDLNGERGARLWDALSAWAGDTRVSLGASFYSPSACRDMYTSLGISLGQVPGNVLDQRVSQAIPAPLGGLDLHLRSAFLQGLLLLPEQAAAARVPRAARMIRRWLDWCGELRLRPLVAALSVVRGFKAVSKVVVGVDSEAQFVEVADAWESAVPLDAAELACDDPMVFDPRAWSTR